MSFNLFGYPTTINGSFLITIAVIGFLSFPEQLDRVILFAAIAVVAVLIHELGHAFAARSQGTVGSPLISLEGMAGFTRYRLAEAPGRIASIFISVAGPLAGAIPGVILFVARRAGLFDDFGPLADDAVNIGIFTTLVWSAFNLLPIVPLDGGHIMTDLIPGDVGVRRRRAAMISIVTAIVIGAALWFQWRLLFAPLILGMMAWQNFSSLRQPA